MDINEFAHTLDNRQNAYPQFTKEELQTAKDNGFVIVCGASDDLMEFYGALEDEGDCFEGGKVYFDKDGVFQDGTKCDSVIEAFWCDEYFKDENGNVITWTYETDIPHETFMIYEDEEPYCRGIVFKLEDIK